MEPVSKATVRASPSRGTLIIVGALLLTVACGLGAVIFYRGHDFAVDIWWDAVMAGWSSPVVTGFAWAMNWLGAGWFGVFAVPILGAIALFIARRPWSAVFFLTSEAASAAVVQILKHVFGRARPEDILVISDFGSFPSGHVANAATIATAAVILFPRLWVGIVGASWVLLMALSRTYLHAHWLSDTLGGALIGVGSVLVLAGVFAPLLRRERPDAAAEVRG